MRLVQLSLIFVFFFSACKGVQNLPSPTVVDDVTSEETNYSEGPAFDSANYRKVVLAENITDPMELDVTSDGRVFVTEWAGAIKIHEPGSDKMRVVGWLPVEKVIEDGLHGLALDPNFDENSWIYIYYSTRDDGQAINRLSRFTYDGQMIAMSTEIAILDVPVQRIKCCHSGGSVQFDGKGNLFLSTGDNSAPVSPGDHSEEELRIADQGRTSMSTNDLRGKILRITPQPDGSYTIPEGNLFVADDKHRGEIYTMGHRNPYRIAIDSETGNLYWGDVGPNEQNDEFNEALEPGFFGWPYWDGYHDPYELYVPAGVDSAESYRIVEAPINPSIYNTGARELPPAQPAMIAYGKGNSDEHPLLGAGGNTPMSGPIFHYNAATAHKHAIPKELDGLHMIYEWMRHWVLLAHLKEGGGVDYLEPFIPEISFSRPSDIELAPDGRLYVVEWGEGFWGSNTEAKLVRIDYIGSEEPEGLNAGDPLVPNLNIVAPANGSFFDFDEPINYSVKFFDEAQSKAVEVSTYTGFDTSEIQLSSSMDSEGETTITREFTHTPDVHYVDRFAILQACPENTFGTECARIKLHPKTKEAEHANISEKSQRFTHSARPASYYWGGTNLTVMRARNGSMLGYDPINLDEIGSIAIRFKPLKESSVKVYWKGMSEEPIAATSLSETIGVKTMPQQSRVANSVEEGAKKAGMGLLKKDAYVGWRQITLPINTKEGTSQLIFEIESPNGGNVVELDWIRFNSRN